MNDITAYQDNLEFIDHYYPERYNDEQLRLALRACEFLGNITIEYTNANIEGVIKFLHDFCGIAIERGFAEHPGWFPCTRDMAYDEYASRNHL